MKHLGMFLAVCLFCHGSCAKNPPEVEKIPEVAPPAQTVVEPVAKPPEPVVEAVPEPPQPAEPVKEPPVDPEPPEELPPPVVIEPVEEPPPEPVVEDEPEVPPEPVFNAIVTKEVFETTKSEIQLFVEDLNKIIRAGNYNSWLTYLGEDYRRKVNSREFLNDLGERYPVFKGRVNSARDYFTNVVVPSRANDRVDDIEFVTKTEVKAYTEDSKGQKVVLYSLENFDGKWKIVN